MGKVTIPATIEEAQTSLDGLGKLLTAKEWERAAIVYAFTREDEHGGDRRSSSRTATRNTAREFAALGITGLKSDNTVREYRKAWQTAIDDGQAVEVKPGDRVEMPNRDWPPSPRQRTASTTEVVTGFRKALADDPVAAVQSVIEGAPEAISQLAHGVEAVPALMAIIESRPVEPLHDMVLREHEIDYSVDLRIGVNAILRVLNAMRDGRWEPDAMERTLLSFLAQAFAEAAGNNQSTNVIDEIEAFLETQRAARP